MQRLGILLIGPGIDYSEADPCPYPCFYLACSNHHTSHHHCDSGVDSLLAVPVLRGPAARSRPRNASPTRPAPSPRTCPPCLFPWGPNPSLVYTFEHQNRATAALGQLPKLQGRAPPSRHAMAQRSNLATLCLYPCHGCCCRPRALCTGQGHADNNAYNKEFVSKNQSTDWAETVPSLQLACTCHMAQDTAHST